MPSHLTRRTAVIGGVSLLAGCLGGSGPTGGEPSDLGTPTERTPHRPDDGSPPTASESLPVPHEFETLTAAVVSGGPGKDGIPSIDDPSFDDRAAGDEWLDPQDVVFGLVRGDVVRAYPQRILVWHEIVNDDLDGVPVSVTYCPLTGTTMGFFRGATTFGVSGRLVNNNLVMYDRETDSRWPQMLATAISGAFRGDSLQEFPVVWTTWERWTAAHPETQVLTRDTGHFRDYDRDPYGDYTPRRGYYASDDTLFPRLTEDDRLDAKDVVLGARTGDGVVAVAMAALRDSGLVATDGGFLAVYDPALDHGYVYRTDDVDPSAFSWSDGAVTGPDGGREYDPGALPLDRVVAFEGMWFAWSGFYPEIDLYD
jgi:hypothetical protein